MKESVESDALVMPSSRGRPTDGTATFGHGALVFVAEAERVDLLLEQEVGVSHILDLHPAKHLPHDGLDVLVRDGHALQTVDLLDFVHQV